MRNTAVQQSTGPSCAIPVGDSGELRRGIPLGSLPLSCDLRLSLALHLPLIRKYQAALLFKKNQPCDNKHAIYALQCIPPQENIALINSSSPHLIFITPAEVQHLPGAGRQLFKGLERGLFAAPCSACTSSQLLRAHVGGGCPRFRDPKQSVPCLRNRSAGLLAVQPQGGRGSALRRPLLTKA